MANDNKKKTYTKEQIEQMIIAECKKWGVNPAIALGIAKHESGLRADAIGKNSNGTKDRGVFQLNSAYFKLKDWSDPVENISRGVQHIAALQKTFGNDLDKILMAYNAGAGAVQSGKVPNVTKNKYLPNAKAQIASYDKALVANNGTLNRSVQSLENIATGGAKPVMNNGITGAASNAQLPPELAAQINTKPTSAAELESLLKRAQEGDTAVFKQYDITAQQLSNRYDTPVQVGTDAETGEPIMMSPRQMDILKQRELDTGLNAAREKALGVINPYTNEAQEYSNRMHDRLNNYYDQQLKAIQATAPTGYQGLTPEQVRRNAMQQQGMTEGASAFTAAYGGNPLLYTQAVGNRTQNQLAADQLAYQQMVANQAGIPFDQYIKMKQAEASAAQNMVNQIGALSQQDMQRLGTSATAAQNLYKSDVEMAKARMEDMQKAREFDQKLVDTYGGKYADLLKQQLVNNGEYAKAVLDYSKGIDVAEINRSSNLGSNVIAGQYGLERQGMVNAGDLAVARTEGEINRDIQQLKGAQQYKLTMDELEHPTKAIPAMARAYSDYAFGLGSGQGTEKQFFGSLPTDLTGQYFPNFQQAVDSTNVTPTQNPTSRDNLFFRMMYGNYRNNQ